MKLTGNILKEMVKRELTEKTVRNVPNISACCLLIFPVGIGLKQVLVIKASRSASYHIFKHPAAPAPKATKIIPIIASVIFIIEFEVNNPTAHVNITRDITLGFISNIKDLIKSFKSNEVIFFLIVLLDKIILHLLR